MPDQELIERIHKTVRGTGMLESVHILGKHLFYCPGGSSLPINRHVHTHWSFFKQKLNYFLDPQKLTENNLQNPDVSHNFMTL